jgi:benzil reductase ((S)-benzoin forming)
MRLAVVTGTSSGIGAAVARQLLANGWQVIGIARRTAAMGEGYRHLALDLADVPGAARAIEKELGEEMEKKAWQRIGLVNNAAAGLAGRFQDLDAAKLARLYAINCAMPLWLMGFIARRRPPGAELRVVNVSSGAAMNAFPGLAAYCSSKAALRMAGMTVAAEQPPDAAILSYEPGLVDTEMQRATRSHPREAFPWVDTFHRFHDEGLLAPPEAPAAGIVAFLESARTGPSFTEARRS